MGRENARKLDTGAERDYSRAEAVSPTIQVARDIDLRLRGGEEVCGRYLWPRRAGGVVP